MVSDSSGVCTSNSGSAESYDATPTDASQFDVGMLVVCLHQYNTHKPGHLDINAGDILEGNQILQFSVLFFLQMNVAFGIGWDQYIFWEHFTHKL